MKRQSVFIRKEPALGWLIVGFLLLMSWRFFTGAHMNGEKYFDTLFFKDATPGHKRRQVPFSAWKRMARVKRMAWRNGVFWPCAFLAYGWYVNPSVMIIVTFWSSPIWGYLGFYWLRKTFFEVHRAGYAEGQVESFWTLKRRYRWMRFEWLRPEHDEPSVTVSTKEDIEHGDFKIMTLQSLLNPGDDADEGG